MTSIDDARDARVLAAADAQVRPALDELARMIAIPSVSSQPRHAADVAAMADHLVGSLRGLGWSDVRTIAAGGRPAVLAHWPAPQGRPTVCLYSHYDVQPVGDPDRWSTDPFTATERDGRLHGRGAADDKGGLAMHLAALRAHDGRPPVGVTVLFEGEEELGSPSLDALLAAHRDELAADAYVIADCENWRVGVPTFTTSLRGVADMVIEVRALERAVHSGEFGGVVPDALTGLCRLLAGLHDENGDVAVAGLVRGTAVEELDHPPDRLRAAAGVLKGRRKADGVRPRSASSAWTPPRSRRAPMRSSPRPGPASACASPPATPARTRSSASGGMSSGTRPGACGWSAPAPRPPTRRSCPSRGRSPSRPAGPTASPTAPTRSARAPAAASA